MFVQMYVTRKQGTLVYLEVPDGTDLKSLRLMPFRPHVARAAEETVPDEDWEVDSDWSDDIAIEGIKQVTEDEATAFEYYKVK